MSTRRSFLRKAAALGLQSVTPLSLSTFTKVASAALPASAPVLATAVAKTWVATHVETIAELTVEGFNLQKGIWFYRTGQFFDSDEELEALWPMYKECPPFTCDINDADGMDEIFKLLTSLPENKRDGRLDDVSQDLFDSIGTRTANLHQLLMQAEEDLLALQTHPDFLQYISDCNTRHPEYNDFRVDHSVITREIFNNLKTIFSLSEKLANIRAPEQGRTFTAQDYFCYIARRRENEDVLPVMGTTKEHVAACIKEWFETNYQQYYGYRLGLYDLSPECFQRLQSFEANSHLCSILEEPTAGNPTNEERNFGSEEAFQNFLKNRKIDPELNAMIDAFAAQTYKPAAPTFIDVAKTIYEIVAPGRTMGRLQEAVSAFQRVYGEAAITIIPNLATPGTFALGFSDSRTGELFNTFWQTATAESATSPLQPKPPTPPEEPDYHPA